MLERLLIVGVGSIGRRHIRVVRGLAPDVRITVLRRHCPDAPEAGIDRCVAGMDEALSEAPQAAVIACPASRHLEFAIPLADAGVHLLIEKPISTGSAGVADLIALCRDRATVLMTGYNLRFLPSLRRFRELLGEGRVGRVLSVRAEVGQYLPSWRPDADYRGTVSAQASLGGGVLLELSHEIDYLRWLFGEVSWVSAVLSKRSTLQIDVEDTAHLLLGFSAGDDEEPLVATLHMDFVRHDSTRSCTVIGEAGSLRWNALEGTIDVFKAGGDSWESLYARSPLGEDSYVGEWRHFIAMIASGGIPDIGGDDGLAVLRIIEAARESHATRTVAAVDHAGPGRP